MSAAEPLKCPVCRAAFRQERRCPRCGADLTVLMRLVGRSFLARQAARAALRQGDLRRAGELARRAQQLQDTHAGRSLALLAAWTDHIVRSLGTLRRGRAV